MTVDISKIKPGDTVRVRIQTRSMRDAGVAPIEVETVAYLTPGERLYALGWLLDSIVFTVLSHTPKAPDWTDALVVRDVCGNLWGRLGERDWLRIAHTGRLYDWELLEETHAPITVVIDADGQVVT